MTLASAACGSTASLRAAAVEPAPAVDFQRDVRPILSDNCFACHGPDEATREADLRLDTRDGAFSQRPPVGRSNRPRGPAVVPGDTGASLLVERIHHADPLRRMPPEVSQKSLSGEQIETLTLLDRAGRGLGRTLVVRRHRAAGAARRRRRGLGARSARPLHPDAARGRGTHARRGGRPPHPRPARRPRPDRASARSRHARDLPRRHGRRAPTNASSTASSPRHTGASTAPATGWTRRATATPTASTSTTTGRCTPTATG